LSSGSLEKTVMKYVEPGERFVWGQRRYCNWGDIAMRALFLLVALFWTGIASVISFGFIWEFGRAGRFEPVFFAALIVQIGMAWHVLYCLRSFLRPFFLYYAVTDKAAYIISTLWPGRRFRFGPEAISEGYSHFQFGKPDQYGGPEHADFSHFHVVEDEVAARDALRNVERRAA
jgi:hypothetical protein